MKAGHASVMAVAVVFMPVIIKFSPMIQKALHLVAE